MDMTLDQLSQISNAVIKRFKQFQFGSKAQLAYLEDFYTLINDGIPANRAIEMMSQVSSGINRDVSLSIAQKISEGQPLAEGMKEWFSPNVIEIIRVGEEGGALVQTVHSAVNTLTQRGGTFSALISAILYPLIVIIMSCIIIVYLDETVFVQFKAIKPMAEWPSAGKNLVFIATLIKQWWWLVFLIISVIFFTLRFLMANYVGEFRAMLDQVFPFSLYRRFAASRMLETLGLLVANGVVFKSALKVMHLQSNPYVSSHLVMMEHLLSMGRGNIADVLATGLVKEQDILRLRVMAEVKGFEHGLIRMGIRGSEENIKTVRLIAKILGGTMLAIGGIMILVIVRGIYLTGMAMSV